MLTRTTAEWRERLDAFDVPNGGVNDLPGLVADSYLRETASSCRSITRLKARRWRWRSRSSCGDTG